MRLASMLVKCLGTVPKDCAEAFYAFKLLAPGGSSAALAHETVRQRPAPPHAEPVFSKTAR